MAPKDEINEVKNSLGEAICFCEQNSDQKSEKLKNRLDGANTTFVCNFFKEANGSGIIQEEKKN